MLVLLLLLLLLIILLQDSGATVIKCCIHTAHKYLSVFFQLNIANYITGISRLATPTTTVEQGFHMQNALTVADQNTVLRSIKMV